MKKIFISYILIILVAGCATVKDTTKPRSGTNLNIALSEPKSEEKYQKLLYAGVELLKIGKPKEAIDEYFNPLIAYYEGHYGNNGKLVFSARDTSEQLYYLIISASLSDQGKTAGKNTIVISALWSRAFYFKGYSLIELGQIKEAKNWIKKAIELSPKNSTYLSELGHIYHQEKKWQDALDVFEESEDAAETFSPDDGKIIEPLRAKRGVGFSLIALNRLGEAEKKFKECITIDKNDEKAKGELNYIQFLRTKNNQ